MAHRQHPEMPPAMPLASSAKASATRAYRLAWWSLALYPVSFVVAFIVGEGILSAIAGEAGDAAPWQVLAAGVPALLAFLLPGMLAVVEGRKAVRLGRDDGRIPAIVGAVVGIGFVGLNLLTYVAGLVLG